MRRKRLQTVGFDRQIIMRFLPNAGLLFWSYLRHCIIRNLSVNSYGKSMTVVVVLLMVQLPISMSIFAKARRG